MSETSRTPTDEWKWRRREAIIRDDYTCQECAAQGGPEGDAQLHVQHTTPVGEGGSDELENLKTLCDPCHRQSLDEPGDPDTVDDTGRVHDKAGTFTHKYDESTFTDTIRGIWRGNPVWAKILLLVAAGIFLLTAAGWIQNPGLAALNLTIIGFLFSTNETLTSLTDSVGRLNRSNERIADAVPDLGTDE